MLACGRWHMSQPLADAGQQQVSAGIEQLVRVQAAAEQLLGPWPPPDAGQQQTSIKTEQLPVQVLLTTSSLSVEQGR